MICELYQLSKSYLECIEFLAPLEASHDLPPEILVTLAICHYQLGHKDKTCEYALLLMEYDASLYEDLYNKCISLLESQESYA